MSSARFSCFSSWEEWSTVRDGLYSSLRESQSQALSMVQVWRSRGGVPASVESTAQIIDTFIKDQLQYDAFKSTDCMQLMYSVVILRAVNLIVEPNQQGYYAESVLTLAQRAGIPSWIVELRHEATHKHLPSLSVLRSAAQFLLQWYREHYWDPQYEFIRSSTFLCMECIQVTNKRKKALKDCSVKIRKCETMVKEIVMPVFMMYIDNECNKILSQSQDESYYSNLLSHSLVSAMNLFDACTEAIQTFMMPIEMQDSRSLHDTLLVPILCHLFSLLHVEQPTRQILIKTCFVFVWAHKVLQLDAITPGYHATSLSVSSRLYRQFVLAALDTCKIVGQSNGESYSSIQKQEDTIKMLMDYVSNAVRNYAGHNIQSLAVDISRFEAFIEGSMNDFPGHSNGQDNSNEGEVISNSLTSIHSASNNLNFPVWPLGLVPGKINCNDLLSVEIDMEY